MRKMFALLPAGALLLVSGHARSQSAEGGVMQPPKPPEELQQLKDMIGTWKCEGRMTMAGHEMKDRSTVTFSWDLDRFVVASSMQSPKSKENPDGYKGKFVYGYDGAAKELVAMGADNMGGLYTSRSKGWDGDKMEWTGKARVMGMELDTRETITRRGPREVQISGNMGTGPQAMTWDSGCKK
jgi:hypothetical protein